MLPVLPKLLELANRYNLLENLSSNLLIDEDHNGAFGKVDMKISQKKAYF